MQPIVNGVDPERWHDLKPGHTYRLDMDPGRAKTVMVMPRWDIKGDYASLEAALKDVREYLPGSELRIESRRWSREGDPTSLWYGLRGGGWVKAIDLINLRLEECGR